MNYETLSKEELLKEKASLEEFYKKYQQMGLTLNMARGKPSTAQLDLSSPILDVLTSKSDFKSVDGDVRNYGVLSGITEAKELMSKVMECGMDEIIIGGNASLTLMYDSICRTIHTVYLVQHLGASLIRLSSYVLYRDMTDILL